MSEVEFALQVASETGKNNSLVIAPLLVALVTAILTLLARFADRVQKAISVLGIFAYAFAVYLVVDAVLLPLGTTHDAIAYQVSDWAAPFGITAVADPLSAFMLAVAAVVSVPTLLFSVVYVDEFGQRLSYHPLFHFMLVGVSGAFLTGDVFNLFVWFEVMLMSSYVLVVFYSGAEHTRAAMQYVVLNLVGSGIMLVAIGGLYATTGTLNMADMARRLADPARFGFAGSVEIVLGISAILFAVFALKAGIVPFQFWVPAAYRAAPAPVSAMLAGVVKKVGIYAIVRLYFTVFSAADISVSLPFVEGQTVLAFYGPVLFVMAAASIFLGGISAIDRDNLDDLLAYSSIGQVGFIVLPLAVAATVVGAPAVAGEFGADAVAIEGPFENLARLALTATLIYTLNHALAKSTLFLASGAIWDGSDTIEFDRLGGIAERSPLLAGSVFVAGIALVGIPPVVGFFGKFLVFDTALRAFWLSGTAGDVVGVGALVVALGGAVLTIAYFTRAWNRGFWGEPGEAVGQPATPLTAVVVVMALTLLVVGIGFDPVLEAAQAAAEAALDRSGYQSAVEPQTAGEALSDDAGGDGHGSLVDELRVLAGVIRP